MFIQVIRKDRGVESGLTICVPLPGKLVADLQRKQSAGRKTSDAALQGPVPSGMMVWCSNSSIRSAFWRLPPRMARLQIVQFLNADQGTDRPGRVGVGKYKYTIDVITGR